MTDPLVPAKFNFAEVLSWKFNKFLRRFQTDNPMTPCLYFTLELLLRWLLETFTLKETPAKKSDSEENC